MSPASGLSQLLLGRLLEADVAEAPLAVPTIRMRGLSPRIRLN
jgi:hypothetical protein